MAVLVKFAFDWPLLVRKGAVDGVVECLCSLVVGRVDLNLSGLGYMAAGRAVRVVVRGGGMRLEVDEVVSSSEPAEFSSALALTTMSGVMPFVLFWPRSSKGRPPERGPLKRVLTPPFLPVVLTITPARSRSAETTPIIVWCVYFGPGWASH